MGDFSWVDGGGGVEPGLWAVTKERGEAAEGGGAEGHDHLDGRILKDIAEDLLKMILRV